MKWAQRLSLSRILTKPWLSWFYLILMVLFGLVFAYHQYLDSIAQKQHEFEARVTEQLAALDLRFNRLSGNLEDFKAIYLMAQTDKAQLAEQFSAQMFERFPEISLVSVSTLLPNQVNVQQLQFNETGKITENLIDIPSLNVEHVRATFTDDRDQRLRLKFVSKNDEQAELDLILPAFQTNALEEFTPPVIIVHFRVEIGRVFTEAFRTLNPSGIDIYLLNSDDKVLHAHASRLRRQMFEDEQLVLYDSSLSESYAFLAGGLGWRLVMKGYENAFAQHTWPIWLELAMLYATSIMVFFLIRKAQKNSTLKQRQIQKLYQSEALLTKERALLTEELQRFTYILSHDFRAPLRHLRSFSEIAKEELAEKNPSGVRNALDKLSETGYRFGTLIDDLLELCRIGRADMMFERLNLSEIASASYLEARKRYPKVDLQFRCTPELYIIADRALISVALSEIFDNAIKYSQHRAVADIQFGVDLSHADVRYFVRDNGCGVDDKFVARAFAPFNQLNAEDHFGGIGIGLAKVRRIIERHEGRVWMESKRDAFTIVYFTLPQAEFQ